MSHSQQFSVAHKFQHIATNPRFSKYANTTKVQSSLFMRRRKTSICDSLKTPKTQFYLLLNNGDENKFGCWLKIFVWNIYNARVVLINSDRCANKCIYYNRFDVYLLLDENEAIYSPNRKKMQQIAKWISSSA